MPRSLEIIEKGKTYNFEHLPKLLWVAIGERLPDIDNFERLRKVRNAIQHFCSPGELADLRRLSLEFLYNNIDPLINRHFDLCAIEYHEDHVGYDYIVRCLIQHELYFSIPDEFEITEIDLEEELSDRSAEYREGLTQQFSAKGLDLKKIGA